MTLGIELDHEDNGRWLAELPALFGVSYGATRADAAARVQAPARRDNADRLEHGEIGPALHLSFEAA